MASRLAAEVVADKRRGLGQNPGEIPEASADAGYRDFFGFGRDVPGVQNVHCVFGDAQQEALPGGVDHHHGGFLSEALPADDGQGAVSPAPPRALAQPALQEPHEAQHRAQGHDYPQPEDQCIHSAEPLGDVEDAGNPHRVVLVQDHNFAVRDQPAVEQDVGRGAGGAVQFDDLSRFQ